MNYGIFGSSEDPTKIGDTVRGIMISLTPIVIFIARQKGIDIAETDYAEIVGAVGLAIGAVWTAYGLIKKLFVKAIAAYGNL